MSGYGLIRPDYFAWFTYRPMPIPVVTAIRVAPESGANVLAYFVAFGPHGPRAPYNPPNNTMKVIIGTTLSMLAAYGIVQAVRASGKQFLHSKSLPVADVQLLPHQRL